LTFLRCGGHSLSLIIWSLCRTVTPPKPLRFLLVLTMNSTTAMTSTRFWVQGPLASPSRTLLAAALATWCLRRSTSSPLMMTALWVFLSLYLSGGLNFVNGQNLHAWKKPHQSSAFVCSFVRCYSVPSRLRILSFCSVSLLFSKCVQCATAAVFFFYFLVIAWVRSMFYGL